MLQLGNDIINESSQVEAGQLFIKYVNDQVAVSTIEEYINVHSKRLDDKYVTFLREHSSDIQEEWNNNSWYNTMNWFASKSLFNKYCLRQKGTGKKCESFNQLFTRVAYVYSATYNEFIKYLRMLQKRSFMPSSPTLINAGLKEGQFSSCFLLRMRDDMTSIRDSYNAIWDISMKDGGVGCDISRIRNSDIQGLYRSGGLHPLVMLIDGLVNYIQRAERRSAINLTVRCHHIDVLDFSEMRLPSGDPHSRVDIATNLTILMSNLFYERLEKDEKWTLFCPKYTPLINETYGEEYNKHYIAYEQDDTIPSSAKRVISAREMMKQITTCQINSGLPYLMNWDCANYKSNQRNLGYISGPNLCLEIVQYTSDDEHAVCNLASLSLPYFVHNCTIQYDLLSSHTRSLVYALNRLIDHNYYPTEPSRNSNMRHRPMGIGVSGFADMLYKLDTTFEDDEAMNVNSKVFACMYFNALCASVQLSITEGKYQSFEGSPLSEGKFQFDLWSDEWKMRYNKDNPLNKPVDPTTWGQKPYKLSNDIIIEPSWDSLRKAITTYGVRNSLLMALMPTSTSASALNNAETVEAHQGNIYTRSFSEGSFPIVNEHLRNDLLSIGAWNKYTIDIIQSDRGSVQKLYRFIKDNRHLYPSCNDMDRLKFVVRKYKTMMEIDPYRIIVLAAQRSRYICSSCSSNIYLSTPTQKQLTNLHVFANKMGLKTGMYYLRQLPSMDSLKLTTSPEVKRYVSSGGCEACD
jgi:ribonucleoside-diphosphate reductase alpha chain